jgi:hypothetical protein
MQITLGRDRGNLRRTFFWRHGYPSLELRYEVVHASQLHKHDINVGTFELQLASEHKFLHC